VLVHCAAGAYRTGGVVAAYRMLVQGGSPADAWAEMKRYDWDDSEPQLPDYLNSNMAELAAQLVQLGVIDEVPDPLPVLQPG
jgi:protein tyrosine phosphatase